MASFPTVEQLNKARTEASQFSGGPTYSLTFTVDGKQYSYIPSNVAENGGMTAGENTYLLPYFTSLDNLRDFGSKAQEVDLSTTGVNNYLKSQGLSEKGYLIPFGSAPFDSMVNPIPTEVFGGELNGLKVIDGQVAYGLSGGHGRRYATTTGEVHDPYIKQNDSFLAGLGSVIQNMGPLAGFIGNLIMPGLGTGISVGSAIAQGASPEDLAKSYLSAQLGSQVGAEVGAQTGSTTAGSIAGSTTSGLASGQSLEDALTNAAIKTGMSEATSGKPSTGALPGGTQVASSDGGLPRVEMSGAPIYAESSSANTVSAPVGYDLIPASMSDQRPEGSYYDAYQNAWFMPNAEDTQALKDLQAQLQNPTDTTSVTPPLSSGTTDFIPPVLPTTTDTSGSGTSVGIDTTTGALPTTTTPPSATEIPSTEMPPVEVVGSKDPYTGEIEMDLSGSTPTTTPTTTPVKTTTGTGPSTPTSLGQFPASGSNVGQITSSASTAGALPTAPSATMLAAAPLEKQNMVLSELTQLYPQLANVDPRLLQVLSGKAKPTSYYNYGSSGGGATPLMNAGSATMPTAGMPFKASTAGSSNLAGLTSSTGAGALSRAGLSMLDSGNNVAGYAKGGLAEHKPEFITGATGHHVKGEGDGQSDSIPAMLADGEYVFDADTVASLGNGSNDAGAAILDKMRENLRKHKRSAPAGKIPPKAKSPLEYMKG